MLDLDDTLLDDRSATRSALSAFLVVHRSAWDDESEEQALLRWRDISNHHWQRFEDGKTTFVEQRRARVRDFLRRSLTDGQADYALAPYRRAYEASWTLVSECHSFIEQTPNIPNVIVTNGERTQQQRKIHATGLHHHVVGVVTPMDSGHWKPRPEIFLATLGMLKLDAHQCLMIGDDPIRDIEPARQLGMKCFQVQPDDPRRGLLGAI